MLVFCPHSVELNHILLQDYDRLTDNLFCVRLYPSTTWERVCKSINPVNSHTFVIVELYFIKYNKYKDYLLTIMQHFGDSHTIG